MCAATVIAAFGWTYVIHYIINVAGHHSDSIESGIHGHIVLVSVVVMYDICIAYTPDNHLGNLAPQRSTLSNCELHLGIP